MIYLTWLILLGLVIFTYINPKFPFWVPLSIYLLAVFVRAKEKYGNYKDWVYINERDEELKLNEVAEEMSGRGLGRSSIREKQEEKVKEDCEFDRKKRKRAFWVEMIDSLFLR